MMTKRILSLVVVLVVFGLVALVLAVEPCEGQTIASTSPLMLASEPESNFAALLTGTNATSTPEIGGSSPLGSVEPSEPVGTVQTPSLASGAYDNESQSLGVPESGGVATAVPTSCGTTPQVQSPNNVTTTQHVEARSFEEELLLSPVTIDLPFPDIQPWRISSTSVKIEDLINSGFSGKYLIGYCPDRGQNTLCEFVSLDNSLSHVRYFSTYNDLITHLLMLERVSPEETIYCLKITETARSPVDSNGMNLAAESLDQINEIPDNTLKYFEAEDYAYTYLGKEEFDCGDTRWSYPEIVKNLPYVSNTDQMISFGEGEPLFIGGGGQVDIVDYSSHSASNVTPFRYDPSGYNWGGGGGSGGSADAPLFSFQKNGKFYLAFSYDSSMSYSENSPYNSVDIAFVTDYPDFSECYRFYIDICPHPEESQTSISVTGSEDGVIAYLSYDGRNNIYKIDRDEIISAVGSSENIKVDPLLETDVYIGNWGHSFRKLYDDIYYFTSYESEQGYFYYIDLSTGAWERFEIEDHNLVPRYIVQDDDALRGYGFRFYSTVTWYGVGRNYYYFTKFTIDTSKIDFDPSTTVFPITTCQEYLYLTYGPVSGPYCNPYLDFENDRVYFFILESPDLNADQDTGPVLLRKVVSLDISGDSLREEFVDYPDTVTIRGRYWDLRAYETLYPSSGVKSFDGRYIFNRDSGTVIALDTEALKDLGPGSDSPYQTYYIVDYSDEEFFLLTNTYDYDNKKMTSYFVKAKKKENIVPPASTPTLIAPINGKYIIPAETQFQWRKFDNTEKYALFIRDLETNQLVFNSLAEDQYITGSGEELVSINSPIDLLPDHKYRWNIWAIASDGEYVASESFDFNIVSFYPTGRPLDVLSPVEGPLMVKNSLELFGDTEKWRFNQHNTGGHVTGGGIGGSNDTYAWDVNLHTSGDTDADNGKPVYAVASGVVADRYGVYNDLPVDGSPGTYGKIIIEHEYGVNKWYSAYLHLDNIQVEPGDEVTPSTLLGNISSTGTDNNHLHLVFYTGDNSLRGGLTSFDAHIVGFDKRLGFTPANPMVGGLVTFNITEEDLTPYGLGDVKNCSWDVLGNHADYSPDSGSKLIKKVIFQDPGPHIVTATVFLNDGTTYVFASEINITGLEIGDILLMRHTSPVIWGEWKHAGMYVGENTVIEAPGVGNTVTANTLDEWLYPKRKCVRVLEVQTASVEDRIAAAEFAKGEVGQGYDLLSLANRFTNNRKQADGQYGWYCSELVWGAYYDATDGRIDLSIVDPNLGKEFPESLHDIVLPVHLDLSLDTKMRCEHIEEWPEESSMAKGLFYYSSALSDAASNSDVSKMQSNLMITSGDLSNTPIKIKITDPEGFILNDSLSEIDDAYIYYYDENGNQNTFSIILNPKDGEYHIEIIPETSPSEDHLLTLMEGQSDQNSNAVTKILLQNQLVSAISDTHYSTLVIREPIASFIYSINESEPFTLSFHDTSYNVPQGWIWDFGDNTGSDEENPVHVYDKPGMYVVKLEVSNIFGVDSTEAPIILNNPLKCNFTARPLSGDIPLNVNFSDSSMGGPTNWTWHFGDGRNSVEQNPRHTYTDAGLYNVTLTVSNLWGNSSLSRDFYINATSSLPIANFTGCPTEGQAPLKVQFNDTSTCSSTSWNWTFGDGNTSTEQHPVHTYTVPGTYTVSLTVTNSAGSNITTRAGYITVSPAPEQNILWDVPLIITSGTFGQTVTLGSAESATRGYDAALDVPMPPDAPGAKKSVYFMCTDLTFGELSADYKPPVNTTNLEESWTLCIRSDEPVQVAWDTTFLDGSDLFLTWDDGTNAVAMQTTSGTTLPAGSYSISISASTVQQMDLPLQAGWNLVSTPFKNATYTDPQNTILVIYGYNTSAKGYEAVSRIESLVPGEACWIASARDCTVTVTGAPASPVTAHLRQGWNLIGSTADQNTFGSITITPAGSWATPFVYGYDPQAKNYVQITELQPGEGYWGAVIRDCTITFP